MVLRSGVSRVDVRRLVTSRYLSMGSGPSGQLGQTVAAVVELESRSLNAIATTHSKLSPATLVISPEHILLCNITDSIPTMN